MAIGKYTRIDNKRSSSSYCSTVTIVVFVALCLVGVWMMTSSSVVPVQNMDVSQENKNDVKDQSGVKDQVSETNDGNTRQFEDNPGDLPEDATKEDSNVNPDNNEKLPENQEKTEEKSEEKSFEDARKEDGDQRIEDTDSKTENSESNSEVSEKNKDSNETSNKGEVDENSPEKKSDSDENEKKSESDGDKNSGSDESERKADNADNASETKDSNIEEKVEENDNKGSDENSGEKNTEENTKNQRFNEVYPSGAQSELLNESTTHTGSFSTQASESKNEKETQESSEQPAVYNWKLCEITAGPDFIPCLDNLKAIKSLRSTKHYEHRERHCPEEPPTCLVSLPEGYRRPIEWPKSREKVELD